MTTITRTVTIRNPLGIHARPAARLVQAAQASGCTVTIALPGAAPVSAESILSIMGLGLAQGDVVTITATGDDAESAAESLAAILHADA
ncbi:MULTISPECIES: HPr family phosphocarrier protein [Bifidobacterium]|uniref:Phosphocarrier protein HPr n=1 Tax=Bifidobacterium scaligerum TaxID=2052656 RepID=A0A2M9HQJ8_9BIFI|nr:MULTISPECIES: HPr family phosphocarrier protein [Bifidobacterium]PJM79100.1 HPr family phosphocarrier protein [Bifidobacterium scaligerum]